MIRRLFAALLLTSSLIPSAAEATPFQSARIRRIVDGREVFINRQPAQVNQQASKGQEVSTGLSRAELLFDRRAWIPRKQQLDSPWESCFRLQQGQVLINEEQLYGQQSAGGARHHLRAHHHSQQRIPALRLGGGSRGVG